MASLLFWWSTDGAPIDDAIWRRMVAQAAKDAGLEKPPATWLEGPNYRALAISTLRLEPAPVRRIEPGILVLSALRHPMADQELLNPPHEEPAAVICFDEINRRLRLSRDFLGHRRLVWTRLPGAVLVTTREETLLRHPRISAQEDTFHIQCHLADAAPPQHTTPFSAISQVPCGATLMIDAERTAVTQSTLEPIEGLQAKSDQELAAAFRDLLDDAVARSVRGASRVGIHLSAGMDSPALGASLATLKPFVQQPLAVTFGFPTTLGADLDERIEGARLAEYLGFAHVNVDASTLPISITTRSQDAPIFMISQSIYRNLFAAILKAFSESACEVAISGHGGDEFVPSEVDWMHSAWKSGRINLIWEFVRKLNTTSGFQGVLSDRAVRRTLKHAILGEKLLRKLPILEFADKEAATRYHHERRWIDAVLPELGSCDSLHLSTTTRVSHARLHTFGKDPWRHF